MQGCAEGKSVLQSRIAAGELILRPPTESSSLALPGSGRGRPEWGEGRAVLGKPVVQSKRRHPRVASLIREGSDRLERGRRFGAKKKPGAPFGSRPLPVAGAVSFDPKLYGITKREGACVGEPQVPATHRAKRKSPPQRAPKEKGTFRCPFLLVRKMGLEPTHRSTGF